MKSILLINTGGTISGKTAKKSVLSGAIYLPSVIRGRVSAIEQECKEEISIHFIQPFDLDSSNIRQTEWESLADLVAKYYDEFDAFLITHGTNTLGYTSAALSFSLENVGKPVIITGSQVAYGESGSDAELNLENALRVATSPFERKLRGVITVFGSHIITGPRAKKRTEFDYDAFQTFTASSIGRIGRKIVFNTANLAKHLAYYPSPAKTKEELRIRNQFDPRIISLTEFPGMSPSYFQSMVEHAGVKGFILRSFGAGDASNHLEEAFQYLKRQKIPIVVTTQAPSGISNFSVNGPGKRLADHDLAIPAWDMSIESQTAKLCWLLAQEDLGYEDIKGLMVTDLRGEIEPNREA